MSEENFENNIIFALDIGTRTIIGTVGKVKNGVIEVVGEKHLEHEERAMIDGQIHNINLVAATVMKIKKELEEELKLDLKRVSIAAAGRFLKTVEISDEIAINEDITIEKEIIKSLEISATLKAEEKVKKGTGGKLYCVGYSVKNYYLNSYLISNLLGHKGEKIGVDVICTFLPRSVIDSLYTVMDKVGLEVNNLTLEPIAAIEAAIPQKLRLLNIALVDIGAGTSDIAISKDDAISAYGMVPFAGDEITEIIAQEYLVEFNTAERIKRDLNKEEITYEDIMGFESTIKSEEVKKVIKHTVKKLAKEIGEKIINLNGGKAPSAIFLVGGGAHTPNVIEELSCVTGIAIERIGIKDRKSVKECVADNNLGSAGVTVLGILLSSMRRFGEDFINVNLNNKKVSLFNSHKHKVLDVLIIEEIKSDMLIGKHGKNIRFYINGKKRIAFGKKGENAKIFLNGDISSIDSKIKDNDNIIIDFAKKGADAKENVAAYINKKELVTISIENKKQEINPVIIVNGEEKTVDYIINNEDNLDIIYPTKIRDFKRYILKSEEKIYVNNNEVSEEYILSSDDIVSRKIENIDSIKIKVNGNEVILEGKKEYIFVDSLLYTEFDINKIRKESVLKLNGEIPSYTEKLRNGDNIEIII